MRAFTLESPDAEPALRTDLAEPTLTDTDVLVRVQATSPNPVDLAIAAGAPSYAAEFEFPVTLGRDFAGIVERVGAGVTRYARGDEVYGFLKQMNPTVHDGTWAELIAVPHDRFLARKPANIALRTAGAVPLSGVAALTAIDALELAGSAHVCFLRDPRLGWVTGEGPGRTDVGAAPTTEHLDRLAELLERGEVRVPIHRSYRFEHAIEALRALGSTHKRGKLAIAQDPVV